MEKILIDQNNHWSGQPYPDLLHRTCLNELLGLQALKEILVILGVKRISAAPSS